MGKTKTIKRLVDALEFDRKKRTEIAAEIAEVLRNSFESKSYIIVDGEKFPFIYRSLTPISDIMTELHLIQSIHLPRSIDPKEEHCFENFFAFNPQASHLYKSLKEDNFYEKRKRK